MPQHDVIDPVVARELKAALAFDRTRRSLVPAYLVWSLLFWAGGHRFYLGRRRSGWVMLATSVASLGAVGVVWGLLDAFRIPGMVRAYNNRLIGARAMRAGPPDGASWGHSRTARRRVEQLSLDLPGPDDAVGEEEALRGPEQPQHPTPPQGGWQRVSA